MAKFETELVHGARAGTKTYGFVNPKLVRGSTVLYPDVATRRALYQVQLEQIEQYGLDGTETHFLLADMIAAIEGGTRAIIVGSGLAAVAAPLLAYLKAGDHLLMPDSVYGPSRSFCDKTLNRFGVETTYYDPLISEPAARALLRPNTAILFTESPGSHSFEVQDVPMLARVAHQGGAKLFMDNTWGIHHFQPFRHGVDVSIQALTKYAGGHSDLIIGAVTVASDEDWSWLRPGVLEQGHHASPDDCWLTIRGLRTLSLRLKTQSEAALHLASWLAARPEIARVLHPALPSCPGHAFFRRDFSGAAGLFAVVFQPRYDDPAVVRFIDALQLFGIGASWGGFESLVLPSRGTIRRTTGSGGFGGEMVRLHIGLEAVDDLRADLEQAFAALDHRAS